MRGQRHHSQVMVVAAKRRAEERERLRLRLSVAHQQLKQPVAIQVCHSGAGAVAVSVHGGASVDEGPVLVGRKPAKEPILSGYVVPEYLLVSIVVKVGDDDGSYRGRLGHGGRGLVREARPTRCVA